MNLVEIPRNRPAYERTAGDVELDGRLTIDRNRRLDRMRAK